MVELHSPHTSILRARYANKRRCGKRIAEAIVIIATHCKDLISRTCVPRLLSSSRARTKAPTIATFPAMKVGVPYLKSSLINGLSSTNSPSWIKNPVRRASVKLTKRRILPSKLTVLFRRKSFLSIIFFKFPPYLKDRACPNVWGGVFARRILKISIRLF